MNNKILKILLDNKNQYISNSEISKLLNISTITVNKTINKLKQQGYNIISSSNNKYCLLDEIDILDKHVISSLISKKYNIEILDTIDSTNTYLKSNKTNYNHIVISNEQTGGRGRLNRKFFSLKNSGIYMSILVNPNCFIDQALKITALTSVAVYSAIKEQYGININIKWVNDLIINNLKVGGILCEGEIELNKSTLTNMIIGIGINVKNIDFPNEIKDIATSIENNTNKKVTRNDLIASIINYFDLFYTGDISYMDIYKKQSNTLNKEITVYQDNKSYDAKAIDIDNNGNLIVISNSKQIILNSGEITIR